ncbi:MAG: TonB-dependent receptor [Proteobacteria bacterium]|nr:MAG: TonB-dependent receptor [Pseudomonadota bacterium]
MRTAIVGSSVAAIVQLAGFPAMAADTSMIGLEEVVVTAQRREESAQRAAIAITAVTGDALTQSSVTQATDLTRLMPSIQVAPASSLTQIYLRGVGTFAANAFAEQGVAFNVDGVYLSRPAAPAGVFYDLERIEVLKGPQGTLYGRNASGGAVNVITAKPVIGETGGFVHAEFGNYSAVKSSAAINLAVNDHAAFRLSGQYVERDGYFNDGYDDEDSYGLRAQFRLDTERMDFTIMADYAHVGGQGSGGTIMPLLAGKERLGPSDPRVIAEYLTRVPTPPVPQIFARDDGYQDNEFYGVIGTLAADVGFATLTLVPAYRKTDLDFVSYASSFYIDVLEESEQSSLEVRLSNTSDSWNWVAGLYYFDESVTADQFFDQASNGTLIQSNLDTTSYAAFGQITYSITDTFRLTGGMRYTKDAKEQQTYAETRPFTGFVPPGPPDFIPIIAIIPTNALTDIDFTKTTWKLGIELDVAEQSLLYASVATGFKSGILYSATGRNHSDPENLTAYTVGSKNRFLGNTLQLNLEAFYWDYEDQHIAHLGPVQVAETPGGPIFGPVFMTENAGQATIYGLETELLWQPYRDGLLSLNLQYLNTEYDELRYQAYSATGSPPVVGCPVTLTSLNGTTPAARIYEVDCSGRPMVNAPEWTLNAGYEHRIELGGRGRLIIGADTRIESSRYLSTEFLDLGKQKSYTMSNARLTYETESGAFALTAFINNIEDELVFSNSLQSPAKSGTVYNQMRPPRTYGARMSVKF